MMGIGVIPMVIDLTPPGNFTVKITGAEDGIETPFSAIIIAIGRITGSMDQDGTAIRARTTGAITADVITVAIDRIHRLSPEAS